MSKNDRFTSLIWAAIGFYVAFEGYQLELGTLHKPMPGFMIFWTGFILAGLSLGLFFQTFLYSKGTKKNLWRGFQWPRGLKLMLALIVYVSIFRWLGFILGTFFLLLFLFKGLEPQKWSAALILSIVTTILCFFVFKVLLEVQFPEGVLGGILNW
jgi:hypothetical protein